MRSMFRLVFLFKLLLYLSHVPPLSPAFSLLLPLFIRCIHIYYRFFIVFQKAPSSPSVLPITKGCMYDSVLYGAPSVTMYLPWYFAIILSRVITYCMVLYCVCVTSQQAWTGECVSILVYDSLLLYSTSVLVCVHVRIINRIGLQ